MDDAVKAGRSQALVDSIEELISLERDVSDAITQRSDPQVMVPVTPVAFMRGKIVDERVVMGLGQDYYVERTPTQAKDVLDRRIAGLERQASEIAQGPLLLAPPPAHDVSKVRRRRQKGGAKADSWSKGFLSSGRGKAAAPDHSSRPIQVREESSDLNKKREKRGGDQHARVSPEMEHAEFEGTEDEVTVEGEGASIMEIREWLDDAEQQTSVEVIDIGKVLQIAPNERADGSLPRNDAGQYIETMMPPTTQAITSEKKDESDLDAIFAKLEQQEAKATEAVREAASPSLGREWKRGFLHGGTKSSPPPPARPAAVITDTQEVGSGQTSPVVEPGGNSKSSTKSTRPCNAFQELVVEKSVDLGAATVPVSNVRPCEVKPPRVSRFRARRQGLQ